MGLTMVKFNDDATRDHVLETGILHFDRKSVIIRPWSTDLSDIRMICSVPLWIRLQDLGLQYWGSKCLSALVSTIGKPIMVDKFTRERTRVLFARMMVEMYIIDNSPRTIQFLNEHGQLLEQGVEYEWLSVKCKTCAGFGHSMADCRKEMQIQGIKKDIPSKNPPVLGRDKGEEAADISSRNPSLEKRRIDEKVDVGMPRNVSKVPPAAKGQNACEKDWLSPKKVVYRQGTSESRNWNLRGLNGPKKQAAVLNICSKNKVGVGALLETKMRGSKVTEMMVNKFLNWDYYSSSITEGRILIIWRRVFVKVTVIEETSQYVHCKSRMASQKFPFSATFVYGHNTLEERKILWQSLPKNSADAWVMLGDFNAVFTAKDRNGGKPVSKAKLLDSSQWFASSHLDVLKQTGSFFTWTNNQDGHARIYSKIDHVFANEVWLDMFPNTTAVFKWETISYHCSCTLSIQTMEHLGVKLFRYYNFQADHKDFKGVALDSWRKPIRGIGLKAIYLKTMRLKHKLKKFNRDHIGDIGVQFHKAKDDF
ncbi:uncharacterized protein LOC133820993 [Humulus lupulus]|uniref:uncharacterized protein LOC133820993 n=1 Tax=Humulus lupulus TaxID=3486 RepID=UPI002B40E6D8|nr:uncharacterized protein LOC133820993 [Humulus lupulus]